MSNTRIELAELVRLLQEKSYVFATDPQPVTHALRDEKGSITAKILRRAELIDSDHGLRNRLLAINKHLKMAATVFTTLLFVGGILAVWGLMVSAKINFFYLLFSVLGGNALMFLFWLWSVRRGKSKIFMWALDFLFGWRFKDNVDQAIIELYGRRASAPKMRWLLGQYSHRFWIASLGGMLFALFFLLLVRQYHFVWESTLLSNESMVFLISVFSWLPEKLGLAMPDLTVLAGNRDFANPQIEKALGHLLLASILIYGLLPRFGGWLICYFLYGKSSNSLPLHKPYYQKLIQDWQKRVVDADRVGVGKVRSIAPARVAGAAQWACTLEAPWPEQDEWYHKVSGQNWLNKGAIAGRDEMEKLLAALDLQAVWLLVGVRGQAVPDRGLLRHLESLAQAARGGFLVQLLAKNTGDVTALQETLAQWHTALNERGMAWLDPPHIAQNARQNISVAQNGEVV